MNKTLQTIQTLASNDHHIEILWLYGSRAKGSAQDSSDYDLAVAFKARESDPLQNRLRPELLAEDWAETLGVSSTQISVVDIDQAPIPLATAIITEGHVMLCKNPLRLATTENRITSKWEIDHLYHMKHYPPGEEQRHG